MNFLKALVCLFGLLSFSTMFAQDSGQDPVLEKTAACSIYFNSDEYELDAASQKVLNDFFGNHPTDEVSELRLKGFTDDVGAQVKNEALAQKRALVVQAYLEEIGVSPNKLKILASEELPLDNSQNIAKQRKENRRVVVEYWSVATMDLLSEASNQEALNAFFDKNRKASQQRFSVEAAKNTVITGAQGTVLYIPANCFVNAQGTVVVGVVSLVLQEVYSYKDMILQNLATASNGKQLETGGMLYLEAKDASGNVLAIREGAVLDAEMVGDASKLPRMQTFEGENTTNTSDNTVNWLPTGQFASNRNIGSEFSLVEQGASGTYRSDLSFGTDSFNEARVGIFYQKSNFTALKELSELYISTQKMPRKALEKPTFKIRPIKSPRLRKIKKVSRDDLKAKYPKSTKETNLAYNSRILSKYIKLKKVYRRSDFKNRKKIRTYKKDSSKYVAAYEKHKGSIASYGAYKEEMKLVLSDLHKSTKGLDFKEQDALYSTINTLIGSMQIRNESMRRARMALIQRLTALDTIGEALLIKLNAYKPTLVKRTELDRLQKSWKQYDIPKLTRKFYRAYSNKTYLSSEKSKFRTNANRVKLLYERLGKKENLSAYDLVQIRKKRTEITKKYNYKVLKSINANLNQISKAIAPTLNKFLSSEDAILSYQDDYAALRAAHNLPAEEMTGGVQLASVNDRAVLSVRNMGWINCDRFARTPQQMLANMYIKTESTQNASFYVIFKDINSVMNASLVSNQSFMIANVPASAEVKVVGLKKTGDDFELFLKDGTIGELNTVNARFEKKTEKELNQILAKL